MKIDEIQTIFNNAITDSPWWQRFKGSEFVRFLVTFVSMVVERVGFASERRLQESFLTRAVSPSSVLAGAESRGYIPMKRQPNKKRISVENKTTTPVQLPALTKLHVPDKGLYYLMQEPAIIPALAAVELICVQAEIETVVYRIDKTEPFTSIYLKPDMSDRIAEMTVFVTEPFEVRKQWTKTKLFRSTTKESMAYVEFYTPGEQIGIRFGNGSSGRMPPAGSLVELTCLLTDGAVDVPAGISMNLPDRPDLSDKIEIVTLDTVHIGADRESIESIRQNAIYYPSYDEQIVWSSDHYHFIRTNIPGLNWISVWGEAEQELIAGYKSIEFINQIYISANHPALPARQVQSLIESLYKTQDSYNESYNWVEPVWKPFSIKLTGSILTTNTPEAVVNQIKKALTPLTASASALMGSPTPDKVWGLINETGLLTKFNLDIVGVDLMSPPKRNEFRHLSLDACIFDIRFKNSAPDLS